MHNELQTDLTIDVNVKQQTINVNGIFLMSFYVFDAIIVFQARNSSDIQITDQNTGETVRLIRFDRKRNTLTFFIGKEQIHSMDRYAFLEAVFAKFFN